MKQTRKKQTANVTELRYYQTANSEGRKWKDRRDRPKGAGRRTFYGATGLSQRGLSTGSGCTFPASSAFTDACCSQNLGAETVLVARRARAPIPSSAWPGRTEFYSLCVSGRRKFDSPAFSSSRQQHTRTFSPAERKAKGRRRRHLSQWCAKAVSPA
jgi:hypothetical protein